MPPRSVQPARSSPRPVKNLELLVVLRCGLVSSRNMSRNRTGVVPRTLMVLGPWWRRCRARSAKEIVWRVQNMSRMTPQRTTTLDFIDPKIPPHPRPPNTASDSPQRPRSGAATETGVS
eukprot:scaffold13625_cov30-Phaeocystis_antarctica.AAC.1